MATSGKSSGGYVTIGPGGLVSHGNVFGAGGSSGGGSGGSGSGASGGTQGYVSSGGGGSGGGTPTPTITVNGTTVFVNGQGYSVPLNQQVAFIQSHGGGGNTAVITQVQENIKQEAVRQQQAQQQLILKEAIKQQQLQQAEKAKTQGVYNSSGNLLGVETNVFGHGMQSYSKTAIENINKNLPETKYSSGGYDANVFAGTQPKKEQLFLNPQYVYFGDVKVLTTPYGLYYDPTTGKPIPDITAYLKEKSIPVNLNKPLNLSTTAQEFKDYLLLPQVYDIKSVPDIYKTKNQIDMEYEATHKGITAIFGKYPVNEQEFNSYANKRAIELAIGIKGAQAGIAGATETFNALSVPVKTNVVRIIKGANIYFTGQSLKEAVNPENSPETRLLNLGFVVLGGSEIVGDTYKLYQKAISKEILTETVPSLYNAEKLKLFGKTPLVRQRATFLPEVINKEGKSLGVVLTKNVNKDVYESLGGKVEIGETQAQAVLREAREESGIRAEQIKNFKEVDKLVNAKELHTVFTGQISEETFKNLVAKSDVGGFKLFNPVEFENFLGATQQSPRYVKQYDSFLQGLFGKTNKVRTTEAMLLGRFENVKKINNEFEILSSKERNAFYLQADKTVSGNIRKKLMDTEKGFYRDLRLYQEGKLPVASYIKTPKGKILIGIESGYDISGEAQLKIIKNTINKPVYKTSLKKFASTEETILLNDKQIQEEIKINEQMGRKNFKNPQFIASGAPSAFTKTKGEIKVLEGKAKRSSADVLFFQPPLYPAGEGYIATDYVLGGGESEFKLGLLPKFNKKTILYGKSVLDEELFNLAKTLKEQGYSLKEAQQEMNKYATAGKVGATAKSVYGVESELGATVGTRFELTGEKQFNVIEGQVVETRNIRRIVNKEKLNQINNLYDDWQTTGNKKIAKEIEQLTGINPSEINNAVKTVPLSDFASSVAKELRENLRKTSEALLPKEFYVSPLKEINLSYEKNNKISSRENIVKNKENLAPKEKTFNYENLGKETYRTMEKEVRDFNKINERYLNIPETIPIKPTLVKPSFKINESKQKQPKPKSLGVGYNVFGKKLKSKEYFKINNVPLTKSRAEDVGAYYVSQTLARTFVIRKAQKSAQEDFQFMSVPEGYFKNKNNQLREYKIRKGNKIETPEQFIQKANFALNTPSEKKQIQAFRKQVAQVMR